MVRRINKSLFNLCRERYNKIAGKVQKLQFIYVIYGRMKELTEQGRVNKTAMTGHTIMGILLALVNFLEIFFQECSLCGGAYCAGTWTGGGRMDLL